MIYGAKLLREDYSSLRKEGRVIYPLDTWVTVGGNGAYIAITGGLHCGGDGPRLAYFACRHPAQTVDAPAGVQCYHEVKRLANAPGDPPAGITPELCGEIACCREELTREDVLAFANNTTPDLRGWIACCREELTREDVLAFAEHTTAERRREIACWREELTREDVIALGSR